ncbi:hypothetical protein EZ456_23795 [Pedobacter psychrodurus]|uniref:Uncharacterized protein n=1 Tax=Pedobacter psychrodurus TaxID=2530456 RepID=A0A4R0PKM3_9SPHI|nr:hypothetical protein [Pedobacter psychrodurus]TCD16975.1 hypothetical protein EZ456_23795 [Pedobacter psychrodurus]
MIPHKIKALFKFIDFLESKKTELIEKYIPLCDEISKLDIRRNELKPDKNYIDKLQYNDLQNEIHNKFEPIIENIYNPITEKLKELEIWSGDNAFSSIWNNNISSISEIKREFSSKDVTEIIRYKQLYLSFRSETNSSFLCLSLIFHVLDEILKELFDFFKNTKTNEFDSFETKTIEVDSIEEAVKSLQENRGKNIKLSIPTKTLFKNSNERNIPTNLINVKNEIIMGDKFENIQNSTIYNRSTFTEAFNTIKTNYNEESAQALEIVKFLVEKSENKEAGELFDSFNEEVSKEKPKTSVLKSLWEGLTKIVPMITETVGLVDKIMPLIHH